MSSLRLAHVVALIATALAGCSSSSTTPAADATTTPPMTDGGTVTPPPPPPPADGGAPITDAAEAFPVPEAVLMSPDEIALIPTLPKDANGNPIILEVGGAQLTIGPKRVDAIGAAARCLDKVTACIVRTKDLDACVDALPTCATDRPWEESTACCASACITAYREERRLGASPLEADLAVFGSDHECFPGRQDMLRQVGADPFLAPRRAP